MALTTWLARTGHHIPGRPRFWMHARWRFAGLCLVCSMVAEGGGVSIHEHDTGDCDRAASRRAEAILSEHVWPVVNAAGYELPSTCELHPARNMFAAHEQQKERVRATLWRCLVCRKTFRSEYWLDEHMARRHPELLPSAHAHECLGDMCGILNCDSYGGKGSDRAGWISATRCDPQRMGRERAHCRAVLRHCFPREAGAVALGLHDRLSAQMCDAVRCGKDGLRKAMFVRPESRWVGLYYSSIFLAVTLLVLYYGILWNVFGLGGAGPDLRYRYSGRRAWLRCCCKRRRKTTKLF